MLGLGTDPRNVDVIADHFRRSFCAAGDPIDATFDWNSLSDSPLPVITPEMVIKGIREMPNGKATGNSKLDAELLKPIASSVAIPLSFLFNECSQTGFVPSSWKKAILVPVPKVSSPSAISEYRPISVLEHMRKLYEKILFPYFTSLLEPLDISQNGFRARRATLDAAAALQELIIEHRARSQRALLVAFLDIKAAYDSVDRTILFKTLAEKGVPNLRCAS